MDRAAHHKSLIAPLRRAMADYDDAVVRATLADLMAKDAVAHLAHPLGDCTGPVAYQDLAYAPLSAAWPDLERRDYIVIAGQDTLGHHWVGCAGFYCGTFLESWLDIPPTGHLVHMRFHEFYRFDGDQIVEVQSLWDIPEVMMQARAWPMSPSLGREWCVPAPATMDGLSDGPRDADLSQKSCDHVLAMLDALQKYPSQGGPEVMDMPSYWNPRMNWYGPAGIGTGRGIVGFRNWHQIPFIKAMPDRGQHSADITAHFFGDGNYVGVTGWPDMIQTVSADGWLGIAPAGKKIEMRSLDFWRLEQGLIRENWVLVDLLHVYSQLGVDVLARMREFNKARYPFDGMVA